MTERYVELHASSAFSFLRAASLPEELVERCEELDIPAMAILDRDNLSAAPRFFKAAADRIRPHVGAEVTGENNAVYPLLVKTQAGYRNLCRLIAKIKMRAESGGGAATLEDLAAHAAGLVCLTDASDARLVEIFGKENVYAELQRHYNREEERRNQAVVERARRFKLPLLATNGVCYADEDRRELFDALTCVRLRTTLDSAGKLLARNSERHLKPAAAMCRIFADLPEAIAHTVELSSRLEFTLANLGYEFPEFPVPEGQTMDSYLRNLVAEMAPARFEDYSERVRNQIEKELALIEELRLAGYFLIVWDIVRYCRENGILVQGRGSAANSAVCYALHITAVDSVKMDLLFERFLSKERGEYPDIDLDLPSGDLREQAIQYVYQRYGRLGAAMTANVITYRGRSAARDLGKALSFDEESIARLSRVVPHWGWQNPDETVERQFRKAGFSLENPQVRKFFKLYCQIQDLPRHLGQHSGGMIVCRGQLDSIVPLQPAAMPGRVIVQWDKDDCADMGIIKIDLLGLGMMAVLQDTQKIIHDAHGEDVDLAHLPQDCPTVYSALRRADTIGLFQVESRAQMAALPRLRPEKFYDLVVQVGIIRPGPIVGDMMHPYLRRRQGKEAPVSLHPSLDAVLKKTLGVPLFQEQLLQMAMIASNFTGGEAEELRRAFGFKRSEARMSEVEVKLRKGMAENGIVGDAQDRIVQAITSFALYGFPESHAISFALIAYASAWLKCHYLAAFTAATLNNQPMGFYQPDTIIKDAQRHGLRVAPVDVTCSEWDCTVQGRSELRLGLRYVKGLPEQAARAVVSARPFESVNDLRRRVPELTQAGMKTLARIGALNGLKAEHRRRALWQVEAALRPAGPLFATFDGNTVESPLKPMEIKERLSADYSGTGIHLGRHPLAHCRDRKEFRDIKRAIDLPGCRDGRRVKVAGAVICRQRPGTAHGITFFSMEDETGIINLVVMPDLFERETLLFTSEPFLIAEGVLQNQDNVVSVKVDRAEPFSFVETGLRSHDFS
ncbi:MAG: error-prone DNA polymerase [Bryobacteraceae bacterium]